MTVIAQALGLHDEDNKYKDTAADHRGGAETGGGQGLRRREEGDGRRQGGGRWHAKGHRHPAMERLASLEELMKKVPNINAALKEERQAGQEPAVASEAEGREAVLAIIAQAAMTNVAETKMLDKADQWYAFLCGQMRDAAAAVNKALHAGDSDATTAAMDRLIESGEDCHKVFKPE